MAFGIDDAIGIGASIAGGLFGDDANKDAAKQTAANNAEVQRMIKEQQSSNNRAFSPYSRLGGLANSRLEQLLGLTDFSKAGKYNSGDLVLIDDQGNFLMNPELANDPNYARTFDAWRQAHQREYNQEANTNRGGLEYGAEDWISKAMGGLGKLNADSLARAEAMKSDPAYGSLLRKFGQSDLDSDVVYNSGLQFGLNEGIKGLNRRAASGGSYDSGATLKALTRYANDYGTTKAAGAYDRFLNDKNTTYNYLSGQQNVGLNATNSNQSLNTDLVGRAVGSQQNSGAMQAQYGLQGAQALNNGIMGGIGNYLYSQRLGSGGGSVVGSYGGGNSGGGGGINLSGYTSSIPWYA